MPPTDPFPEGVRDRSGVHEFTYLPNEQAIVDKYEAYWNKRSKLAESSLCTVEHHCSGDVPMPYVAIASSEIRSWRGHMNEVKSLAVDPKWDATLAEFCRVLDIDISDMKPAWWLVSIWS